LVSKTEDAKCLSRIIGSTESPIATTPVAATIGCESGGEFDGGDGSGEEETRSMVTWSLCL